jgi:hypothetical protein
MKRKDIVTVVVVGIISSIFAIILSNSLIGTDKNKNQTAEIVPVISSEFQRPPDVYFNSNSINPTQTIQIGQGNTSDPFGATPQ